jgi:predicted DNA-binding transcriptional regulator YafY
MSSEGESTYKVLHRILGIHEYLSKQRYPSLSVLAERFGVSTKTIQRDVSFMKKEMNLPIRNYRDLGGYGYTEEVIDMPAMKLSRQEIFALLVAQSSIEQYQGSAFADPLKSFFTKLIGHLAPLDLSKMRDINRYVTYLPNGVNTTSYETLETLALACRDQRSVEITYHAASSGKKGNRVIHPRHLINHAGNWYLLASNENSENIACFHLARMGKKVVLGRGFTVGEEFNLEEVRKDAFGAFIGTKRHKVHLIFDQVAAPFVCEKKWNNSQSIKERKDGSVEFKITVCDLTEIKAWILSWGAHAQVMGPKELVEGIKSDLERSLENYNARK